MIGPDEKALQLWQQLHDVIAAEATAGRRLAAVRRVKKSIDVTSGNVPAIGVQLEGIPEMPFSTGRHLVDVRFKIVVCVDSVPNDAGPADLEAAMMQLVTLIADGNGNGLSPVLRDPANYGLNGLASKTGITGVDLTWSVDEGEGARKWAYALYTYVAQTFVTISSNG